MTVNQKSNARKKRSQSSLAHILLGFVILSVIVGTALLIFVFPLPGLSTSPGPVDVNTAPGTGTTSTPNTPVAMTTTAPNLPPGSICLANPKMPLTIDRSIVDGVKLVLVEGGTLATRRSPLRQGVEDFVRQAGASAGVNGTFFANASLEGTDNLLIGPSLCGNETTETLSPFDTKPQLEGRPMVLISPSETCIVPYDTVTMSVPGAIQTMVPGVTDAFLGGVWLVHDSTASSVGQLSLFNVHDAEDPRRRAFFALLSDGRPVLGATDGSWPSSILAQALADAGVKEAVLLDSGFSTSLVFQQTVLVSGHSTRKTPSRPVPHALVLFGQPDPTAVQQLQETPTT